MPRIRNLEGVRFGRLIANAKSGKDKWGRYVWRCQCDCGIEKDIPSRHLISGSIRSCGCLSKEVSAETGKRCRLSISGEKSHLYNHRLTDDERLIRRNIPAMRDWRRAIYERDNYTCDICGSRGGALNAHHLNSWADHPNERYDLDNGITLCRVDHKAFHDYMSGCRKPCTKDDYRQFKDKRLIGKLDAD